MESQIKRLEISRNVMLNEFGPASNATACSPDSQDAELMQKNIYSNAQCTKNFFYSCLQPPLYGSSCSCTRRTTIVFQLCFILDLQKNFAE